MNGFPKDANYFDSYYELYLVNIFTKYYTNRKLLHIYFIFIMSVLCILLKKKFKHVFLTTNIYKSVFENYFTISRFQLQ